MIQDKATKAYMDQIKSSVARAEPDKLINDPEPETDDETEDESDFSDTIMGFATSVMGISLIWGLINWLLS